MASYNNYSSLNPYLNGYNYQPAYIPSYQQRPVMPQQPMPQQPEQIQTIANTNEIFVNGLEDVRNQRLPVNSNYIFLDNDKALLYEKIVDGRGQFEVKTYEIKEITGQESTKQTETINYSDFVKSSDLDLLRAEIEGIKKQINKTSIQSQIDSLKKGDKE